MPDWREIVSKGLSGLKLGAAEKEEVRAELAEHLEETYEALLREGMSESAAIRRTLSLAEDWNDLRRKIHWARKGKETMTDRMKQLWLPGILAFALSTGMLVLIQTYGPKLWVASWRGVLPLGKLYIPWLLLLPFVGAMGAYLSHRGGGSRRLMLSSAVFPVLPSLASILLVPVSLMFGDFIGQNVGLMSLVMALLGWVLVPGAALLAGALPVLFFFSRQKDPQQIAF